jgi:hypothetical protein
MGTKFNQHKRVYRDQSERTRTHSAVIERALRSQTSSPRIGSFRVVRNSSGCCNSALNTRLRQKLVAARADLSALYAGCAASVSANEVERGSGIQERVAGRLDAIYSGNRVENDLALGDVSFRN